MIDDFGHEMCSPHSPHFDEKFALEIFADKPRNFCEAELSCLNWYFLGGDGALCTWRDEHDDDEAATDPQTILKD